ncbi:acid ceramidase-like protein [Cavenderia fasciculata]|uniref:Acid ceramidase-like protein n=1 Tax=Cavenderia fasciculata TaxID=261658 RepID=F4PLH9_CACFS|nr:acid ceramidase-like protein [Cavenderia fasciculata]EGG23401.1 acid ceramidase-like protein [Cavenderia fasciculata]|eukprot:XP_004361252.1 acid ceramidase-like protein [Cavenderia fasciculata]
MVDLEEWGERFNSFLETDRHRHTEDILLILYYLINQASFSSVVHKMMKSMIILIITTLLLTIVNAQCPGNPTGIPVYTESAIYLNATTNGKLYVTGPADNQVNILQVYGTAYERGYAHGVLLRGEAQEIYAVFFEFVTDMVNELVEKYAKFIPLWLVDLIERAGIGAALDITADLTKKYTPQHFFDEMRGLADGSGLPYQTVLRLHMFPELIKAACSMVGAWGDASIDGNLYQLRALDFKPETPLRLHPVVIVSHPTDGGDTFATLSWAGFLGALTGYSQRMGICEKYWFAYNGTSSREGYPWHFLLRDILQFDNNPDEALTRIINAERTCSIYVGLGTNATNDFRAVEYSHQVVRVFDDQTPFPAFAPPSAAHPLIKDVVYIDKHVQPSNDPCIGSVLQKNHGQINVQTYIDLTAQEQTGDLHIAIYDFAANQMFVSVATQQGPYPPPANFTLVPAYARQFLQIDLEYFFNESI